MKKRILHIVIALSAMYSLKADAQQLPLFSQYFYNPFIINPGFAGTGENTQAFLTHRSQWRDMPGAPVTYALTVDGPVKSEQIGLGVSLFNDQNGIFSRTGLYTSYSYRFKINEDHHIVPGISVGIIDNVVDFSRASVRDVADPLMYGQNQRKMAMDATFGVVYFWNDLSAGISVPQLLGNKVRFLDNNKDVYTVLRRHVEFIAQYKLVISEANEIRFLPSVLARYVHGAPIQFDVNANFDWKEMVRAGVSYRHGYAAAANVGIKLNNNLVGGYAYEYMYSPIGGYSGGAHEIMLGYTFAGKDASNTEDRIRLLNEEVDRARYELDSTSKEQQKQNEEYSRAIEELKRELNNMKGSNAKSGSGNSTGIDMTPSGNSSSTESIDENIRKQKAGDYLDETNVIVKSGYYVIIGAYKNLDNAKKQKEEFDKKAGYNPTILYNKDRELYYVNVLYTRDDIIAIEVMEIVKEDKPDAWVFGME